MPGRARLFRRHGQDTRNRKYGAAMDETDPADPFVLFGEWFEEAKRREPNDPEAMTLATATAAGAPSARMVLLKDWGPEGFVFYTNTQSRKGDELRENRVAALLFHWKSLRRQVRIEGTVTPVSEAEADAYFASRPRLSRIGAWASDQSRALPERAVLEARLAAMDARYPGEDIPRPAYWSGYRVAADRFEFWQDMPYRLHDRLMFERNGTAGYGRFRVYP
jgi:pyridoxamine 5'-phosphate oxidase